MKALHLAFQPVFQFGPCTFELKLFPYDGMARNIDSLTIDECKTGD